LPLSVTSNVTSWRSACGRQASYEPLGRAGRVGSTLTSFICTAHLAAFAFTRRTSPLPSASLPSTSYPPPACLLSSLPLLLSSSLPASLPHTTRTVPLLTLPHHASHLPSPPHASHLPASCSFSNNSRLPAAAPSLDVNISNCAQDAVLAARFRRNVPAEKNALVYAFSYMAH